MDKLFALVLVQIGDTLWLKIKEIILYFLEISSKVFYTHLLLPQELRFAADSVADWSSWSHQNSSHKLHCMLEDYQQNMAEELG
jgi:hypothetical protein